VDGVYAAAAEELGALIARGGHALVYGGGKFGLMGAVARSTRANGGKVTGVIPRFIAERTSSEVDSLIVTDGMRERKARMEALSDAFIALPGGFGTLEEVFEIIAYGQLGLLAKPVAFVNTRDFYDPLIRMFEKLYQERFAKHIFQSMYRVAANPRDAVSFLEGWKPVKLESKWFS
jgi:hypothetical protein